MKKYFIACVLAVFAAGFIIVAFPQNVYACSCVVNPDPWTALDKAEAVFVGKVLSVKQQRRQEGMVGPIDYRDANLFEVTEAWKGVNKSQVIVYDNGGEASCGLDFEKGESYLVYTYKSEEGDLNTSLCSRTIKLSQAAEDLSQLGQGRSPEEQVNLKGEMRRISNKDYDLEIVVGAAMVMTATLLFLIIKRRISS